MTARTQPTHRLGPIDTVTVIVPSLDAAVDCYRAGVGFEIAESGTLSGDLAAAFGFDQLAGAAMCELRAPDDPDPGSIVLVEAPDARPTRPLRTLGWSGIELIVADVDAAHARAMSAGLDVLCPPLPVGAGGSLRAVQVTGAAGEALYLTQVDGDPPGFELPTSVSEVGRVFIVVLTTAELEVSRTSLQSLTGARQVTDHGLPVRAVNRAHGLPDDTLHRVSTSQLRGRSAIEVDLQSAAPDPRLPGVLYAGVLSVAVQGDSSAFADQSLATLVYDERGGRAVVPVAGAPGAYIEITDTPSSVVGA